MEQAWEFKYTTCTEQKKKSVIEEARNCFIKNESLWIQVSKFTAEFIYLENDGNYSICEKDIGDKSYAIRIDKTYCFDKKDSIYRMIIMGYLEKDDTTREYIFTDNFVNRNIYKGHVDNDKYFINIGVPVKICFTRLLVFVE